jgi:hypothetical protein
VIPLSDIINPEYSTTPDTKTLEQQAIENLTRELGRSNERVETLRAREAAAVSDLSKFKDSVRGLFVDKVSAGDLSRETANEWLGEIGMDPIKAKFRVVVTDDNTGDEVLVVTDVEADDEDEACEAVMESLSITAYTKKVEFHLSYDGEWDEESIEDVVEWDELDDSADDYEQKYMQSLSATAEEEDI